MLISTIRTHSFALPVLIAVWGGVARGADNSIEPPVVAAEVPFQAGLSVKAFGAKGDWDAAHQTGADDTLAIQRAIDESAARDAISKVVYIPPGNYRISKTIRLPNRVRLQGDNGRNTIIYADPGFHDPYMFYAGNGTISMFSSRLENLSLFAEDNPNIQAVIKADAWQEGCGLRDVVIYKFNKYALELDHGYGGSSMLHIKDCEFFAGPNANPLSAGIYVHQVSSVAAFLLKVEACSICGSPQRKLGCGIVMDNDTLVGSAIHFEFVTNGICLKQRANAVLDAITGCFPTSPDDPRYQTPVGPQPPSALVVLEKNWTGFLSACALMPNGFEVTIRDDRSSTEVTGNIPEVNLSKLNK